MAGLQAWDPFDELRRIQDRIGRIFNEYPAMTRNMQMPTVDVQQRGNDIVVHADMPGVDKDDIRINVRDGNILEVSAEKKIEKEEKEKGGYIRNERAYTGYYRSIMLPAPVDKSKAQASYKDGVLTVTLPMISKPEEKTSEIKVS